MRPQFTKFARVPIWVFSHPAIRGNSTRIAVYAAIMVVSFEQPDREWRSDRDLAVDVAEVVGLGAEAVRKQLRIMRSEGLITGGPGQLILPSDDPEVGTGVGTTVPNPGEVGTSVGTTVPRIGDERTQTGDQRPHTPILKDLEREDSRGWGPEGAGDVPSPSPRKRKPNPIWDSLAEHFGQDEYLTESERSRRGKVAKELKAAGATPDKIARAYKEHQRKWPNVDVTEMSLVNHWSQLQVKEPERQMSWAERERLIDERHAKDWAEMKAAGMIADDEEDAI